MENELINQLLKETPLKVRLQVLNEMFFVDMLHELGYIDGGSWTPDEQIEKLVKISEYCEKLTQAQLDDIEQWENDGRFI
jgi:hypothetical protein